MPGTLRDHEPIILEEFNGLWSRGNPDAVPDDHFIDCENVEFNEGGFETRRGLNIFTPGISDCVRMYNYKTQINEGLLMLNTSGQIFHALLDGTNTVYGPVLTIVGMEDFGFTSYNGRAYITPFKTFTDLAGNKFQKGMQNEFVYVYKGDGSAARRAAGFPPSITGSPNTAKAFNSKFDGVVTKGVHLIAITDQANNLLINVFPVVYAPGAKEIEVINIPTPIGVTGRKILMTRAIDPKNYVPTQASYTYYEALIIPNNTDINAKVSIADANLTTVVALSAIPTYNGLTAQTATTNGFADIGFHLIAVVFETDTGYLTALGPENFAAFNVVDIQKGIFVSNIPTSGTTFVTKRHLVATKAILTYNGDQTGYQFFFIPGGNIDDDTTTSKTVSFFDADLLDDASHLIDNFAEIPAGVDLGTYHGRMALATTFDDESVVYFSAPGEPEAIDQVDGLIIIPLDGMPITNTQEFRDVFYVFKKTRTWATTDNGDLPSTWQVTVLDQGIGASVHGIAEVLDSGGVNVDFLLITDFSGLMVFNGAYARPELSYKIDDVWKNLDRNEFHLIQVLNDSLNQFVFITVPIPNYNKMIVADWKHGLDAKNVRWTIWRFDIIPNTIALVGTDKLLIATVGTP